MKSISFPLKEDICQLKAGEQINLNGPVLVLRDQAHKRLIEELRTGEKLELDLQGQAIFYASPTPAKLGQAVGSIGPTTSIRMDKFTPKLLEQGVKVLIGKGPRTNLVKESLVKNKAVYLVTVGGAAAFLSKLVKRVKIIAYQDLGPEAVHLIEVENFPAIVAIDCKGNDIFAKY